MSGQPSSFGKVTAFNILTQHPDCLKDDTVFNDLIDDLAAAIDRGRPLNERERVITCLTNCAQIIDAARLRLKDFSEAWSEWDQGVRDEISTILNNLVTPALEERGPAAQPSHARNREIG